MTTRARGRPARAVALGLALAALVAAGSLLAGPAATVAAQPASSTTGLTVPTTVRQTVGDDADGADSADRIWLIIGGLVVVAVLLTALTLRYWWVTRPSSDDEGEAAAGDQPATA